MALYYKLPVYRARAALALLLVVGATFATAPSAYASSPYLASGTVTSSNLLAGTSAASIADFYYDLTSLPGNSSATIQFSEDGNNWYSAAGALGGTTALSTQGGATISLAGLGWSGSSFYYRITLNATSDLTQAPVVSGVRLDYAPASGYSGLFAVDRSTGNVEVGGGGGAAGSTLSILGGAAIGPNFASHKTTNGLLVEGWTAIGTTSPSSQLTLDGSGNGKFFEGLNSGVAPGKGGLVFSRYSDAGGGSDIALGNNYYLASDGSIARQDTSNSGWDMEMNNRTGANAFSINYLSSSGTADPFFRLDSSGNASIGTSTSYARLTVFGSDAASSTPAFAVVNSASTSIFTVFDGGNAELAGTLSQSSDQRLKTNIVPLAASSSLAAVEQLNPVSFNWVSNIFGSTMQLGFIAQQVQSIFPSLVSTTSPTALTPGGTLVLNYTGLIAPVVSAVKEIASVSGVFEHNLVAWLGDAGNGIGDIFAQRLCLSDGSGHTTCVDQQQLAAMLATAGQPSASLVSPNAPTSPSATSTPPQLQVNGNNPATVQVGTAYADLGATITGPQADLNLGISASVDGGATTTVDKITIGTSAAGTHTIRYSATDQQGATGIATRTVNVVAPTTQTPPIATTTPPTAASTIIATSSEATSTAAQ